MRRSQVYRQRRVRQRNIEKNTCRELVWHIILILIVMFIALCNMLCNNML